MTKDTIAAIATPLSNSGIGIIRVSGKDALSIVDSIFVNPKKKHILSSMESHTISYGFLLDGDDFLDEVLVSYFKGPKSFTAEDTVEINCHGGIFVLKKALSLVINAGARLAEPGEFTKRAFLNGRIDLSKAEAVMDVIASESELSLKSSVSQLRGSLLNEIKDIRKSVLFEIAFIESALDDPEHISLDGYNEKLLSVVKDMSNRIKKLINTADNGRLIKDGINTVILGKPNAGKSSLLNLLSGYERAIVTDIAGTTRDVIEEKIKLDDINLCLVDTAGIRDTDDVVESIGVKKALEYADDADLILYVVDSSVDLDENDYNIISLLKDKKAIILYNKSDLEAKVSVEKLISLSENKNIIKTSATKNEGLDEFKKLINEMFIEGKIDCNDEIIITNLRHKEALSDALNSMMLVLKSINDDMPEDFYSIDLMNAYSSLGKIIGEEVDDDLVNEIFSKFCMGK